MIIWMLRQIPKQWYFVSFVCCKIYYCHSNEICHGYTYLRGSVEVIISRLGFKGIKHFTVYPNFEEARDKSHYELGEKY